MKYYTVPYKHKYKSPKYVEYTKVKTFKNKSEEREDLCFYLYFK